MKRSSACVLVFLLLSSVAGASDSQYESNRLDTLHFRNPQWNFTGILGVETLPHYEWDTYPGGVETYTNKQTGVGGGALFALGITDDLSISGGIILNGTSTTTDYLPTGTISKQTSSFIEFFAPSLRYRYIGGLSGSFFSDAFVTVAPKIRNRSDDAVTFGSDFRWVLGKSELAFTPSAIYRSAENVEYTNSNQSYTAASRWMYGVQGTYRQHFLDVFFATLTLHLTPPNGQDKTYPAFIPYYQEHDSYPWWLREEFDIGWLAKEWFLLTLDWTNENYNATVTPSLGSTISPYNVNYNEMTLTLAGTFKF
jgi:hypothetical protein